MVDHFIKKHNDALRTGITGCSSEALAVLCHTWPGNVRDLENAVQSAMIVCKTGIIQPGDLPVRINSHRDDAERDRIVKALEHCRFSKTDTAQYMGISRKTLFNKMKRYGLE